MNKTNMKNINEDASTQDLDLQSDHSSDYLAQPQPRRLRGFAAAAAGTNSTGKGKKEREKEKERTKLRERHRRAITSRMLAGLRQYGNFPLPARADMNDVLAALAREAGWIVDADGTTYRQCLPPSHMVSFVFFQFHD
jgi:beta-amylase